jgi:Lsr2 protein/uncharacterized protein DUF2637
MAKANALSPRLATASRLLWLVVLAPVLVISGYSLFWVARSLGVPPSIAIGMSTCFDGAALLCANYSLKYALDGLSGSAPRAAVRVFALVGAYIQTLHARIGHEPPGSAVLWASLPIIAVIVYEVHIRWERRKALARAGVAFPAPLPAFGIVSWVLFPLKTLTSMRNIVGKRGDAVTNAAANIFIVPANEPSNTTLTANSASEPPSLPSQPRPVRISAKPITANGHAPAIRAWAREQGIEISDRARIRRDVIEQYWREQGEAS